MIDDPTAHDAGTRTLSEAESKAWLTTFGVPFPAEAEVSDAAAAATAAEELGCPVVAKLNGPNIAHKTERGLVRLNLSTPQAVAGAADELFAAARPDDGDVSVLVAPMLSTVREFIAGANLDAQFGPTVLFGVGGVLAEAIADVQIRLAPIDRGEVERMAESLVLAELLGDFRGQGRVDLEALGALIVGLGEAICVPGVRSIDCNPVLIDNGRPIAVDALVEVDADFSLGGLRDAR